LKPDRKIDMGNKRLWLALLIAAAIAAVVSQPGWAARHRHPATHPHPQAAASHNQAPALNESVLQAEVLLARAGFSPGVIDGRDGDNFSNALHTFQQANGLPVGPLDEQTMARLNQLSNDPVIAEYTIQPGDVAGPFVPDVPTDFLQMALLPQLAYRSPRQLLAAKFCMSEGLLMALNPGANFAAANAAIRVVNLPPPGQNAAANAAVAQGSGSSGEP
jgi:peptidoglycan hydrolase-like protein with peptidoglycan-binding domain